MVCMKWIITKGRCESRGDWKGIDDTEVKKANGSVILICVCKLKSESVFNYLAKKRYI